MSRPYAARLNLLNLLASDIGQNLAPFLAVYLLSLGHWGLPLIGIALTTLTASTVLAQTPAGYLLDRTRYKRQWLAFVAVASGLSSLAIPLYPNFYVVCFLAAVIGAAGALIQPAIAALTLGIVGPERFSAQTGSNQAFNHVGCILLAVVAGGASYFGSGVAVFHIAAILAFGAAICVMSIPSNAVDHVVARGGTRRTEGRSHRSAIINATLLNRPFMFFTLSVLVFHMANNAMLPLIGDRLSGDAGVKSISIISSCVIVAQLAMIPVSYVVGAKSASWGLRPLLLVAFGVLPIRGVLFAFTTTTSMALAVEVLDALGAGMFGVLFFLVVAKLTEGTGTFNFGQGFVKTAQGIGSSLSTLIAYDLAGDYGYFATFLVFSAIAAVAPVLVAVGMRGSWQRKPTVITMTPAPKYGSGSVVDN
ncbi:Major Facilitator Superfamily protein [Planctomycetes bacterium Pan216]|uniref:Major Facilitator Superfamily protein n=1 Tax=Kolteria novifilia TaxID=2527975 RepID=A0A518B3A6_9BACT|nr:Major Facilitator Superfamily protein [Planctomycetes bacterium Pan216]